MRRQLAPVAPPLVLRAELAGVLLGLVDAPQLPLVVALVAPEHEALAARGALQLGGLVLRAHPDAEVSLVDHRVLGPAEEVGDERVGLGEAVDIGLDVVLPRVARVLLLLHFRSDVHVLLLVGGECAEIKDNPKYEKCQYPIAIFLSPHLNIRTRNEFHPVVPV